METNCFPQLRQNCWFHLLRAPPALQAAVLRMAILIVLFPPFTPSQKLPVSVCNQTALRPRALTAPPCTWPSISVPGPLGTSCSPPPQGHLIGLLLVLSRSPPPGREAPGFAAAPPSCALTAGRCSLEGPPPHLLIWEGFEHC